MPGDASAEDELDEDEIEQALFRSSGPTHYPVEDDNDVADDVSYDDAMEKDDDDSEEEDFLDDDMSADNSDDGVDLPDFSESSSLEDENIHGNSSSNSKRKSKRASISKTVKFTGSTFASAEEFAHLLEDNSNHYGQEHRDDRTMWKRNMYSQNHRASSKKRLKSSHHQ